MVTMLDCIKRVSPLIKDIVFAADISFEELRKKLKEKRIDELCLIGSGTSYNSALTARYFAEKTSGCRVSVMLPDDFLYGFSVRNPNALYVFISQTGTSIITGKALDMANEKGFLTVGVSEKEDTPIAQRAKVFLSMGCGKEEYGIRTIGYSTSVLTLMWLGVEVGFCYERISREEYQEYQKQVCKVSQKIPNIIEQAMKWIDTSRRRMMKSSFFSFTGAGALYGVAVEASVKMWEAPQYPSGGYELDEGMHGPNYGYNYNHAVFVLSHQGVCYDKGLALAEYMKKEHDNGYIIGQGAMDEKDLSFEPVGGDFDCLLYASAIQVLMYRIAVDGGRDFSILGVHKKMNSYFQSHTEKQAGGEE